MSLKQSSRETAIPRPVNAENDRPCWRRDRNCPCLKVDVAPGESFLFPYQQFLNAQHTRTDGEELLKISFGTHEIAISGRHLAEIAAALQGLAVECISTVPPRYRKLPDTDGAWVTQIDVRPSE
jgi:hypothetical protein